MEKCFCNWTTGSVFLHLTQFIEYFEQSPIMRKKNSSRDSNLISNCWRISGVDSKNECFGNLLMQRLVNKFNGIVVVPTAVSVINSAKLFVVAGCKKSWSNMEPVVYLSWSIGNNWDKKPSILAEVWQFGVEYKLPSKSVWSKAWRHFQKGSWSCTFSLLESDKIDGRMWWPYFAHEYELPKTENGIGTSSLNENIFDSSSSPIVLNPIIL